MKELGKDEEAIIAQGAFFLNREQVKELILAAQDAWRKQKELGLTDLPFEDWRKQTLWDMICKNSFRTVNQTEFNKALDGFFVLSGKRSPGHLRCSKMQTNDEQRRAIWRLKETCKELAESFDGEEGAMRYANSLIEKIHKTKLADATAKQIWQVIFTLKNRAGKHTKPASPQTPQICDLKGGQEKTAVDASGAVPPVSPFSPRAC
jgi:hypothetical protein